MTSDQPPAGRRPAATLDAERLEAEFRRKVAEIAVRLRIPGAAAGIHFGGRRLYAYHGVTSIENPLPVDSRTLFQVGSNTKVFTATAAMHLVEQNLLDLDVHVRTYLPELRLQDRGALRDVRVLQLLNHTAGWSGDAFADTGRGDDALARYVEYMREIPQEYPLGARVSYNNPSFALLGRIIEKLTGSVFEDAARELVIDPLELGDSWFPPEATVTRRFAVGHWVTQDRVQVARRWLMNRSTSAAGALCSTPQDMLRFARFHLNGDSPRGQRVLTKRSRQLMQRTTASSPGSVIGDAVGIAWLKHDLGGVTMVGHGGGTNAQISLFQMVPERDFAIVSLTNASTGGELNAELLDWALHRCLGVDRPPLRPITLDKHGRAEYGGVYRTAGVEMTLTPEANQLQATVELNARGWEWLRAFAGDQAELAFPQPFRIEVLDRDRFRVAGSVRSAGTFVREEGRIAGVNFNGRFAARKGGVDG